MRFDYRFEILRSGVPIGELLVERANIKYDSTADVMRAMTLTVSADHFRMRRIMRKLKDWLYFDGTWSFNGTKFFSDSIYEEYTYDYDIITDRIRPILVIDGEEQSLGTFMTQASPKTITRKGSSYQIESYDETMIIKQAAFESRVYFAAGTTYASIINAWLTSLGFANIAIDSTTATLQTDREFAVGDNILKSMNTLLAEINYYPVHISVDGYIQIRKKSNPTSPRFIYKDRKNAFRLLDSIKQTIDLYSIPNVFIGSVSNPDSNPVIYKKVNNDAGSVLSVGRRGYRVVKKYELDNTASESDLHDYIDAQYLDSLQSLETIEFSTSPEFGHEFRDPIQVSALEISGLYNETAWEMDLGVQSIMKHTAERKVFL